MKHLETAPILASHLNQVTKNYTYVIHQFAPEDIHAFRVEIKKLRAFQRLAGGHHQQHLPKRLQQFYHFTGIIRNLQLQQQRIDEACRDQDQLPAAYLKELSASIATNKLIAFQAFRQLSLKDQLHELKSSFPDILTKKRISLFLETTGIQLQTIANMPHPVADDDLHELRKRLKDILYNYTYIKKVAADLLPAIALAGDETLKQLAGALGMILDIASGIQLLSAFTAFRADNEREKQLLTAIGRKWTKEKEALKKELYPRLTILIPEAGPGHLFEKTNILH